VLAASERPSESRRLVTRRPRIHCACAGAVRAVREDGRRTALGSVGQAGWLLSCGTPARHLRPRGQTRRARTLSRPAATPTPYLEGAACAETSPLACMTSLQRHVAILPVSPRSHDIQHHPLTTYIPRPASAKLSPATTTNSDAARFRSSRTASTAPPLLARGASVSGPGRSVPPFKKADARRTLNVGALELPRDMVTFEHRARPLVASTCFFARMHTLSSRNRRACPVFNRRTAQR